MGTQYKYCNRNLSLFTNVSWQIAEHQRDSISAWSDFLWLGWVNKGQSGRLFSGKEWLLCQALNLILYSSITYDGDLLSLYLVSVWVHSGPAENLKSPGQKNSWNQILNQFHEIFFDQIPFFCSIKNDQKSIFELGKSLKLPEMQFHKKKMIHLISRVFLPGLF